jgi:phosphatidylglycerophosphatase A
MRKLLQSIILFISQGAFSGRVPYAPGTAGTAVGLLLYLLVRNSGPAAYAAVCVAVCAVGVWSAGKAEHILRCKDCPSIVIDEIAGYLVAMAGLPAQWGYIAAGFMLFRVFDIFKPWPVRGLQNLHGGFGVMADDIAAAVYVNVILQATRLAIA